MIKSGVYILFLFLLFSCSSKRECPSSKAFEKTIHEWLLKKGMGDKHQTYKPIDRFPEKFDQDEEKCGNSCEIELNEGTIVFKEYTLSAQFVKDHALETTLSEFFTNDENMAYHRAINVPPSGCLVIQISSEKEAEQLKDDVDMFVDEYFKNQ